ncbi:cholinesterase-like [Leptodactylus fuscus]|uniref:cholinesterase-like n=1 Tax=Leptodactylus fuscus TaxID=238119 RepID=UPI003F4F0EA1
MGFCTNKTCFVILTILAVSIMAEDDTIVQTRQGKVSGIKQSVMSRTVTAYLGIPYGEAPTGERRFQKPEPRAPWHGVYKATTYGKSCYQSKDNGYAKMSDSDKWNVKNEMSEDCLNLNVWVPQTMSKPAHVMVFIHGGGFFFGTSSSDMYVGSVLAASEEVIVVSMNYRLGVFGFLAFPGNPKAPGNAGLFDQRLALQWVQENIAAFGGNPDSITIFGHSAGAASVGYHVISPGSHSYFNRAILQSGTPIANWAFNSQDRSKMVSIQLAKLLNCPTEDEDASIACLQKVDTKEFVDKQIQNVSGSPLVHFVPILENYFITDVPQTVVKHSIKNIDILIGITKDGNPFTVFGAPGFSVKNQSLITTEELREGLRYFFPPGDDLSVESIMLMYKDWDDEVDTEKNREAMEQILRDYYFVCSAKYFANFIAKTINNLYVYEYDHRPSDEGLPEWMGVAHGAELSMLFGKPLISPQQFSNQEQVFSRRLMKIWANFARTGNPSDDNFIWPQYSAEEQHYADLKVDRIDTKQKWNSRNCQFWNSFYPKLVKMDRSPRYMKVNPKVSRATKLKILEWTGSETYPE